MDYKIDLDHQSEDYQTAELLDPLLRMSDDCILINDIILNASSSIVELQ